jgi:hypothetical protein
MYQQNCYPAPGRACICIGQDDNGPVHITVTRMIDPPADAATDRLIRRCIAAALADFGTK